MILSWINNTDTYVFIIWGPLIEYQNGPWLVIKGVTNKSFIKKSPNNYEQLFKKNCQVGSAVLKL